MADLNYVSPLTSDLTDYYTKTEVDELQQGDENRFATQAQITAGDNEVKGWVASQGYLTQHQSLQNYATKEYVDDAIEGIDGGGMRIRVVNVLPAEGEEGIFYLVYESNDEEENRYAEYIWSDTLNGYEMLGYGTGEGVLPDLTDYATKSYVDGAIVDAFEAFVPPHHADEIDYDNQSSGLLADNIQSAIDEIWDNAVIAPDLAAVATSGDYDDLINKPTIPSLTGYATTTYVDDAVAAVVVPTDAEDIAFDNTSTGLQATNVQTAIDELTDNTFAEFNEKANISDLATVATSGSYNDLTDKPVIPAAPDLSSYATKSELSAKANAADLAAVATTGSYNDLSNKPTIPSTSGLASETYVDNAIAAIKGSEIDNDMNWIDEGMAKASAIDEINNNVSAAGLSGDYDDLTNKPTIPTVPTNVSSFTNDAGYLTSHQDISGKVDGTVVSGTTTAKIFNEADGGGAQIITASARGFAGVHDGSNPDATYATMYVKNAAGTSTLARVDLDGDGKAYYLKNGASKADGSEIAVKGDIPDVSSFITSADLPDVSDFATLQDFAGLEAEIALKQDASTLATVATSGDYDDLTNKPTIPSISGLATETYVDNAVAGISVPANTSDLTNDSGFITSSDLPDTSGFVESSDLATVATTGDYDDLTNKPTIPVLPTLATVATSGSYNDLSDKPTIPSGGLTSDKFFGLLAFVDNNVSDGIISQPSTEAEVIEAYNNGNIFIPSTTINTYKNKFTSKTYFTTYYISAIGEIERRTRTTDIAFYSTSCYIKIGDGTVLLWGKDTSENNLVKQARSILKTIGYTLPYSNTTSGLTATTFQGAIDELAAASGSSSGITVQDVLDAVANDEFEASDEYGNTVYLNPSNIGYTNEAENNGETTQIFGNLGANDLLFSKSVDDGNEIVENSLDITPNFDDGVLQVEIDGNETKTIAFVEDLPSAVSYIYNSSTGYMTFTGFDER